MIINFFSKYSSISGPLCILFFFIIIFRIKKTGLYTFTKMRHDPLWPLFILKYNQYYKEKNGKNDPYFLIFSFLALTTIVSLIFEAIFWFLAGF